MLVASTIVVVFVAVFLAAAIAVVAAWMILERQTTAAVAAASLLEPANGPENSPVLLKNEELSTVSPWASLLAQFDFVQRMKTRIEEAGLNWPVGRVIALMLLFGALAAATAAKGGRLPVWAWAGAGLLVGMLPHFYVLRRRAARLAKIEEQLPEALDFLSRALRAGHPFATSLEMLASESSPPLSVEVRKTFDERQLGMSWDRALENLARRVPLMDVSFFSAAVQLQSRTGGKLGEVLGRLAETMRERSALRGEVRAIAAHGRLTGIVLTVIPLVVTLVMTVVNPSYMQILLTHPRGMDLILAATGCLLLAHFVIRRIVNVRL